MSNTHPPATGPTTIQNAPKDGDGRPTDGDESLPGYLLNSGAITVGFDAADWERR